MRDHVILAGADFRHRLMRNAVVSKIETIPPSLLEEYVTFRGYLLSLYSQLALQRRVHQHVAKTS